MKIGIDISQIIYQGTGTATYTQNLVENLLRIDRENDYLLFGSSLRRKGDLEAFTNQLKTKSRLYNLPPAVLDVIWNQWHVFPIDNLIGRVDIFHSNDWTQPPSKSHKVTTIHDLVAYKFPESLHPQIVAVHKRRLVWVKKEIDRIIAVSASTKRDIVELLKFPESKVEVVYEAAGKEIEDWKKLSEVERRERIEAVNIKYGLRDPFVLSVGKREPRKNIGKVVEAMSLINGDYTLVITGGYGWGDDTKETNRVKLLGYVPTQDLPPLYARAKILVYPSLYEGFGLPVVEAMSCGCPVVTSNVSSLPEVGGKAAIYADPHSTKDMAEKINYVLDLGSEKYRQLQRASLDQAGKFSWGKAARETAAVYRSLR